MMLLTYGPASQVRGLSYTSQVLSFQIPSLPTHPSLGMDPITSVLRDSHTPIAALVYHPLL